MEKLLTREDDYNERRKKVSQLSDEELKQRFWDLNEQVVAPLIKLAKSQTSPAIERSVLLRMGFSSIEAKAIVEKVLDHGLIGKGAGHVVYKAAMLNKLSIRDAGLNLLEGNYFEQVKQSFGVKR